MLSYWLFYTIYFCNQSNFKMDTQGTFDQSASGYQASAAVFALSTILSSVQCYNVTEILSDDVLMPLKFFTDYGKMAATEAPDLGTPFQVSIGHKFYKSNF